jgi:hypothetical protein
MIAKLKAGKFSIICSALYTGGLGEHQVGPNVSTNAQLLASEHRARLNRVKYHLVLYLCSGPDLANCGDMTSSVTSLLMVTGLWLTLAIFCCAGGGSLQESKPRRDEAPIIITAPVLVAEYEANEIAADEKYKGRRLQVTGVIDSIAKDIIDSMYVSLDSGQEFGITNVQCFFDDSEGKYLASLSKGRSLTVTCKCDGKFGNVLLRECEINRVGN